MHPWGSFGESTRSVTSFERKPLQERQELLEKGSDEGPRPDREKQAKSHQKGDQTSSKDSQKDVEIEPKGDPIDGKCEHRRWKKVTQTLAKGFGEGPRLDGKNKPKVTTKMTRPRQK